MPSETNADAVEKAGEAVQKTGESVGKTGKKKRPGKKGEEPAILGAVTDQSGHRTSKHRGAGRINDFTQLPATMRGEAERLLTNGATLEEATEWVNEHHVPEKPGEAQGVTLAAVTEYFRGSFEMQRRRIRRMQEMAQELKKGLKGDPHSALAELADAVFFTGVMGLSREGASFSVRDAKRDYLAREALRLREQQIVEGLKTERLKQEKLRTELGGLERTLKKQSEGGRLSPETLRKIQEIYGLINQPIAGSEGASKAAATA